MCEDMSMCEHACVGVPACLCVLCVGRRESSKELPWGEFSGGIGDAKLALDTSNLHHSVCFRPSDLVRPWPGSVFLACDPHLVVQLQLGGPVN